VFDGARSQVLGTDAAGAMKSVVVAGGPIKSSLMMQSRVALSVPLVNAYIHPFVSSHVFSSHPLDLQSFPEYDYHHVGAPCINIETKVLGVDDNLVEKGDNPLGSIVVRGPTVGKPQDISAEDDWIDLNVKAQVLTNGVFSVV